MKKTKSIHEFSSRAIKIGNKIKGCGDTIDQTRN